MALFVWGMGKNGQLGTGLKDNVEVPLLIPLSKTGKTAPGGGSSIQEVVGLGAGGLYTGIVTTGGQVYCTGSGGYGRLGSGTEDEATQLQHVAALEGHKVTQISCGIWHGAAITEDGKLFMWGYNKGHGVLGLSHPASYAPPIELPLQTKIAGVSCGNNYTLAWTSEGDLLSWGSGRHGVLGHGSENDCLEPRQVTVPGGAVAHADAGFAHAGIVTTEGEVYMMGQGKDGALGLGKKKLDSAVKPQRAETPEGVTFIEVSCSKGEHHGHTLTITSGGVLYVWGDGYKGKLGSGDQESRYTPTALLPEAFNGEHVKHVSTGGIHSTAVTEEGRVYTWGCGSDGRLGHPEAKGHRYLFRSDVPRIVDELDKYGHAVQVKASYYHTIAIVHKIGK